MTEAQQLAAEMLAAGKSGRSVAATLGVGETTIRRWREKFNLGAEPVPPEELRGPLDEPIRPLSLEIPPPAYADPSGNFTQVAVLLGDTHVPHHDERVLDIVHAVVGDLRPRWLVHMGDLLDCNKISAYDKDPYDDRDLQAEIDAGRRVLTQLRLAAPDAELVMLEGNHEDRLRRAIWQMPATAQQIARLTAFKEAMTWPNLLGLGELHARWVPMAAQSRTPVLPNFLTVHGSRVRSQSAYTARAEHERYGKSGASGHTHRLGVFFTSDHNGNHVWVETGHTALPNPSYVVDPNWQQGFVVLSFDPDTTAVNVEPVNVVNGCAVFRDVVYRA